MSSYFEVAGERARGEATLRLEPWSALRPLAREAPSLELAPTETAPVRAQRVPELAPSMTSEPVESFVSARSVDRASSVVAAASPATAPRAPTVESSAVRAPVPESPSPVAGASNQEADPGGETALAHALDLAMAWVSSPAPDPRVLTGEGVPVAAREHSRAVPAPPRGPEAPRDQLTPPSGLSLSIGAIEVRVTAPPARTPPGAPRAASPPRPESPPLARAFTSTFGLRQR